MWLAGTSTRVQEGPLSMSLINSSELPPLAWTTRWEPRSQGTVPLIPTTEHTVVSHNHPHTHPLIFYYSLVRQMLSLQPTDEKWKPREEGPLAGSPSWQVTEPGSLMSQSGAQSHTKAISPQSS